MYKFKKIKEIEKEIKELTKEYESEDLLENISEDYPIIIDTIEKLEKENAYGYTADELALGLCPLDEINTMFPWASKVKDAKTFILYYYIFGLAKAEYECVEDFLEELKEIAERDDI